MENTPTTTNSKKGRTHSLKLIQLATRLIVDVLGRVNGLDDLDRKIITYYLLATRALDKLKTFPLLVLRGQAGTGKSETLKIAAAFAYRPHEFNMDGTTLPVVRDTLAEAHEATVIIEEADSAWKDERRFERLLSARYQRQSAKAAHKEAEADAWVTREYRFFGATVLHRRQAFRDQTALDGRSILIRFRRKRRPEGYQLFNEEDAKVQEAQKLLEGAPIGTLPPMETFPDVAPRVFDTFRPILAVARLCGDSDFIEAMQARLQLHTEQLHQAQDTEPETLVLRALVQNLLTSDGSGLKHGNVLLSDLTETIWQNHRIQMQPQQVGAIARDLGFGTKVSGGLTKVVVSPHQLIRAAMECDYDDEVLTSITRTGVERRRAEESARLYRDSLEDTPPSPNRQGATRTHYSTLHPSTKNEVHPPLPNKGVSVNPRTFRANRRRRR